jgi:hypothetical protein
VAEHDDREHEDHDRAERDEVTEREQRLAEPGVDPDERIVGEREGAAELEDAVEERAGQRSPARQRQPQQRQQRDEQRGRQREAQARTPQRLELAVAEPDPDRVAAREDGARHERRERHPLTVGPLTVGPLTVGPLTVGS